jgi:hypothetical protein
MSGKALYLTGTTASIILAVSLSKSVNALPNYSPYFCYKQNPSGQTLNLNELCAQNPPLPPKPKPQPEPTKNQSTTTKNQSTVPTRLGASEARVTISPEVDKVLSFSDLSYRNGVLEGKAKNKTKNNLTENALLFEMRVSSDNVNWKTIDGAIACLENPELPAKATTSFNGTGEANAKRVIISKLGTSRRCER